MRDEDSPQAARGGRRAPSLEQTARRIESEIADLVRQAHALLFGAGVPPPGALPLSLELQVEPEGRGSSAPGESLADQVLRAVRRRAAAGDAWHPGRVFCYRCESPDCDHSSPPRPQSVFAGYGPTGIAQWADLAQFLLDLKDDRVEELFREPPATVSRLVYGRELKGRQLHPFGRASKRYDLLGQLVAGHFGSRPGASFAVTVQAVESRYPDGRARISLNLIGSEPAEPAFQDAFRIARGRVQSIEEDLAHGQAAPERRSQLLRRVPGLLAEMGRSIERAARQHGRRTRHAEERRGERRPTQAATRDAREASDGSIYADDDRGTLIVVGPRGRVHAFTPGGRHVTTLTLEGEALPRRLRQERWRPARREEIARLRDSLAILIR